MSIPTAGYTIAGASSATTAPLPVQVTQADHAADYIPMYSSAAAGTVAISLANYLGTISQTMGITDVQSVSNKTNDNSNTYATKDTSLTLQNAASSTKRAQFLLSSITAGQTRIFTLPDYNGTIATQGGTETLTNKTLTTPIINNATITSDLYAGAADVDSGIIYGMTVTNGVLASAAILGQVNTAALQTNAVGAANLATNAITLGYAQITSNYTNSATAATLVTGLTAAVTIPAGGRKVRITAYAGAVSSVTATTNLVMSIWDGTVGVGTQLAQSNTQQGTTNSFLMAIAVVTPVAGAKTYNIGFHGNVGEVHTMTAGATIPAFILVEMI